MSSRWRSTSSLPARMTCFSERPCRCRSRTARFRGCRLLLSTNCPVSPTRPSGWKFSITVRRVSICRTTFSSALARPTSSMCCPRRRFRPAAVPSSTGPPSASAQTRVTGSCFIRPTKWPWWTLCSPSTIPAPDGPRARARGCILTRPLQAQPTASPSAAIS